MGYWRATARNYLLTASSLHSAFQSLANARSYGSVPLLVLQAPQQRTNALPPSAEGRGHYAQGALHFVHAPCAPLPPPPCSGRSPLRGKGQRLSPAFGRLPFFVGYRLPMPLQDETLRRSVSSLPFLDIGSSRLVYSALPCGHYRDKHPCLLPFGQ